jgi:hypothetical protein
MRTSALASLVLSAGLLGACQNPSRVDDTPNQTNQAEMYPAGPYGYSPNTVIANLHFVGKQDVPTGNAVYSTMAMKPISLSDYYNDPNVKWLVLSGVARWCGPCNNEQSEVPSVSQQYYSKGVRFLEAIIEGQTPGVSSTETDLNAWQSDHGLHVGLVIDPNDYIHEYANLAEFPLNVVIDTSQMRIKDMTLGYGPGELANKLQALVGQ